MARLLAPVAIAAIVLLVACAPAEGPPTASPTPSPTPIEPRLVQPAGEPRELASGLVTPWSVLRLADGTVLVSERDPGRIVRVADGEVHELTTVPGVVAAGEGGLLGLAALETGGERWLYAYFTARDDNRVVRFAVTGSGAATRLGEPEPVFDGIPKARTHNGGRLAFGPDGMLYVTTGDARDTEAARELESLAGKILRLTPTGGVPNDNPFPGSAIYSLGHRNPQGLTWTADGQLWAAELGQNTWDELNRIEPGSDYGWPEVEGIGDDERFVDPIAQWSTDEASPSGLTAVGDTLFMAALRGERVWAIYPLGGAGSWAGAEAADPVAWFEGEFGRIRDVVPGPDGSLWMLTHNTDGRGEPRAGDDRLLEVRLTELVEG